MHFPTHVHQTLPLFLQFQHSTPAAHFAHFLDDFDTAGDVPVPIANFRAPARAATTKDGSLPRVNAL